MCNSSDNRLSVFQFNANTCIRSGGGGGLAFMKGGYSVHSLPKWVVVKCLRSRLFIRRAYREGGPTKLERMYILWPSNRLFPSLIDVWPPNHSHDFCDISASEQHLISFVLEFASTLWAAQFCVSSFPHLSFVGNVRLVFSRHLII